jgi:hypothetical protein
MSEWYHELFQLPKGQQVHIKSIVEELRQELARIESAIWDPGGIRLTIWSRRRSAQVESPPYERRSSSKDFGRPKSQVGKIEGTVTAKKTATERKPMGLAAHKKLSALMKARWAARKKKAA